MPLLRVKDQIELGEFFRQTIQELGGAMPEYLPVADSLKLWFLRRKYIS